MGTPLYRGQGNRAYETAQPVSAAKRGQTIPYDVNGAPAGGTSGGLGALNISVIELPRAITGDPLLRYRLTKAMVINAGSSVADSGTAAAAASVLSIKKNGVQVGTVTFASGGTTGFVAFSDSTFPVGSLFELYPPSPADATLDEVSITLAA